MRINTRVRRRDAARAVVCAATIACVATACTGEQPATGGKAGASGFTFALPAAPISLDITKDFDGDIMQVMAPVTEKLEQVSTTGKLSPALATGVSQPDARTLVYHLRDGVTFSDGAPLTAADVVWSIKHAADGKAGAQTAGNISWIKDVTATGPRDVTVTLTHAVPDARANIAVVTFVQQAAFAKAHAKNLGAAGAVPIGTGPYRVTQDDAQRVTLTRNPHYSGPRPAVARITYTFVAQDNTAQLAMRSGSVQGALVGNLKTAAQWKAVPGARQYPLPTVDATFLTLATGSGPLADVHVRRAIAWSVDRPGVLAAAYGTSADVLKGVTPPGLLYGVAPSTGAADSFLAGLPQYTLDPAKAKAELARSRYPHGFTLSVPVPSGEPASQLVVENLAQNMKALGVTITPRSVSESQWVSVIYAHKNLGMQYMDLTSPVPDPSGLLGVITGKDNIRPQGFNLADWSTPPTEAAYKVLTTSTDRAARWQATRTLLTAIARDVPYVPLFSPDTVAVLGGGFRFDRPVSLRDLQVNGTWVQALKAG